MNIAPKGFMTPKELAEKSGFCRVTINNWIKSDLIKSIKIGGRRYINRKKAEVFLRTKKDISVKL